MVDGVCVEENEKKKPREVKKRKSLDKCKAFEQNTDRAVSRE